MDKDAILTSNNPFILRELVFHVYHFPSEVIQKPTRVAVIPNILSSDVNGSDFFQATWMDLIIQLDLISETKLYRSIMLYSQCVSVVQSIARILIHNAILFTSTSIMLGTTKITGQPYLAIIASMRWHIRSHSQFSIPFFNKLFPRNCLEKVYFIWFYEDCISHTISYVWRFM